MEYVNVRDCDVVNFLFCNSYGQRLDVNLCKHTISAHNKRRAVCKTSLLLFRHTFAKMLILHGGDTFRLQKILRHKSIEIVKEYVNMFTNDLKKDSATSTPLKILVRKFVAINAVFNILRKTFIEPLNSNH